MFVQDDYWSSKHCHRGKPEGFQADGADDGPDPPYPVREKTLVIWHRRNCTACKINEPLFRRLETQSNGYVVVRAEASDQRLRRERYRNAVLAVPQYDIVWYDGEGGGTSAYGPGTRVLTVSNSDRAALLPHFPRADVLSVR